MEAEESNQSLFSRGVSLLKKILRNITIEPTLFFINFADCLDDVSTRQLVLHLSCRNDFGFNETVCGNLVKEFPAENKMVQDEVADFGAYTRFLSICPLFFTFYLGAWCDTFGRKFILFVFIFAKIVSQCFLVLLSWNLDWPKEWFLASLLPQSLVGGYPAFAVGWSSFIADISSPDQRAFRMGMISLARALGKPIGAPLGAYLYEKGSFICVTATALAGTILGGIILAIQLRSYKWQPKLRENENEGKRHPFSLLHVRDAVMVTFKKRPGQNRKFLLIFMTMMLLMIIPGYGEYTVAYLFVRTTFGWEVKEYSIYSSIISASKIVGQAVIIPLVTFLKVPNSLMCILVLMSMILRRVIKAFAHEGWMYYLASLVDLIGSYAAFLVKAMLSLCVPHSDFGKIYAVISAFENFFPLGTSYIYAQVWKASSETFPGAAWLMSAGFGTVTLVLAIYVHKRMKGNIVSEEQPKEGEKEPTTSAENNQPTTLC